MSVSPTGCERQDPEGPGASREIRKEVSGACPPAAAVVTSTDPVFLPREVKGTSDTRIIV